MRLEGKEYVVCRWRRNAFPVCQLAFEAGAIGQSGIPAGSPSQTERQYADFDLQHLHQKQVTGH